jgi:hypothetical protein
MKNNKKAKSLVMGKAPSNVTYSPPPLFPRPICLERCTMNIPNGYENNILKTLKAFSNKNSYQNKNPHKLEGRETWSIDVKSRNDIYRMLFQIENNICKITDLCTTETH